MKYNFTHKFFLLPIITLFAVFFNGCGNDHLTDTGLPAIESVTPETTFVGDTITIFGAYLGLPSDNSYVQLNTSATVTSDKCVKWTSAVVALEVPPGASSGTFAVVAEGIMSNKLDIFIEPLPPYETKTVQAGIYLMGSETGLLDETPVHQVEITHDMEVSVYEITLLLWNSVMSGEQKAIPDKMLPADSVTWESAIRFCNKLSKLEDRDTCYIFDGEEIVFDTDAGGWRLPTEAEWEYLCRADSQGDFAGTGVLDEMGWYSGNSGYRPHPVGRKQANDFGLYDMHGNLWEWCWDYYSADYYSISPSENPTGPDDGLRRVIRGGSWGDGEALARSSNRRAPNIPTERCGFRIVRTIK
jgi:formylglycine-generating enzyme required for sulfatase activity